MKTTTYAKDKGQIPLRKKNPPRYSLCLGELKSSQCPISVGIVNQIKYLIKYRTVS